MEYIIYSKNLANGFEEEIEEKTYNELFLSKEILFEIRSKENIYNMILMNYYDFEKELFEICLKDEIFQLDYSSFNNVISKIEQRILNLLASITFYCDSFKNDLKDNEIEKYPNELEDEYKEIRYFKNSMRKSHNETKIMLFIRNHIQHNGLLVDNFSLNGQNLSDELREQTLRFYINKNNIKARDFNSNDFSDIEENINLKKFIRIYMDFISQVHEKFRELTAEKTNNARNAFEKVLEQYSEHKYLNIAQKSGNERKNEIAILLDWDNIRLEMIKKNHVPKVFKRHSINTK